MKQVFRVGDLVDIVPYDTVADDYGIDRDLWERQREMNPQTVNGVWSDGDHVGIENDKWCFTWPHWAFVPHESTVSLCSVDDLI